jgi:hypothetical protein
MIRSTMGSGVIQMPNDRGVSGFKDAHGLEDWLRALARTCWLGVDPGANREARKSGRRRTGSGGREAE